MRAVHSARLSLKEKNSHSGRFLRQPGQLFFFEASVKCTLTLFYVSLRAPTQHLSCRTAISARSNKSEKREISRACMAGNHAEQRRHAEIPT